MHQKFSQLMLVSGLFAFLLLSSSCQRGNSSEAQLLSQAAALHQEALRIDQEVKPQLEELIQQSNSIQIQGRALSGEEIRRVEAIDAVRSSYAWFENNHVEVPGHDHDHGDHAGHDHDHDHGAELELTPEDMLAVQQEFLDSIKSIRARVALLLQK